MPWSIISVGVCFLVFGVLSRLSPCNPGQPSFLGRESADDLLYYLTGVLFYTGLSVAIAVWLVQASGADAGAIRAVKAGYGWLPRLPLIVQILIILVITDVAQYWLHRLFHGRALWPFHAVHHSAREPHWTTTFRVHPVNQLAYNTSVGVLTQLMGFSPTVFLVLAPLNLAMGAMVHANLNWTFGPFRYVLASPVFHRWHHSLDPDVHDKNFAPTFPVLDLMFGTFHMPKGRLPQDYGAEGAPEHFLGQMAYPFRVLAGRIPRPGGPGLRST